MVTKKKHERVTITMDQAYKSINMCKSNALALMNEAMFLWANDRILSIPILFQFAFEEIGKAKMIFDILDNNKKSKTIKVNIKNLSNHKRKHNAFIQLLKQAQKGELRKGVLFSNNPRENAEANKKYGRPMLKESATKLLELIEQSHKLRLESSFVDFDTQTGDPKYGHGLDKLTLKSMSDAYRSVMNLFTFPAL